MAFSVVLNWCAFLMLGTEGEESYSLEGAWLVYQRTECHEGGGMREWKTLTLHVRESESHWLTMSLGDNFCPLLGLGFSLLASDHYLTLPTLHTHTHCQMVFLHEVWIVRWPESGPRSRKVKYCKSTKLLDLSNFQSKFIWRRWNLDISLLYSPSGFISVLQQNRCLQKRVNIIFSHIYFQEAI